MITGNTERDEFKSDTYERLASGHVAKIPGMDSYPMPEEGNPGKTEPFQGKLGTTTSRFNPLFQFNVADDILSDTDFQSKRQSLEPTIQNLLNPTNAYPGLRYSPIDFMYCRNADYVSGYHMITLRRFSYPIDDGLMMDNMPSVDIGRLVTYTTEEVNKLSEIMTMSFGLNWRELTADFWTPEIIGNEAGASGLLGTMFEVSNPMYLNSKGLGKNAINVDPMHDQNKTYGPVDSITKTHIRDRGLNFNQDINVTFEYDICSYDAVNPRAALIDLLSNILVVTFNDAKFWGGANKWRGMSRWSFSRYMSANDALKVGKDFASTVGYYKNQLKSLMNDKAGLAGILELANLLLKGLEGFAFDKLVGTLGRPTVAVMNSLLSGEPVGTWHLTIGNPFRPIMSIGNLILTNSTLSFGDTLSHDGFPNTVKLVCTLKHAKPRSRADIEMMFNAGKARTYWMPNKESFSKAIKKARAYKDVSDTNLIKEISNEIYAFIDNEKLGDWFK